MTPSLIDAIRCRPIVPARARSALRSRKRYNASRILFDNLVARPRRHGWR